MLANEVNEIEADVDYIFAMADLMSSVNPDENLRKNTLQLVSDQILNKAADIKRRCNLLYLDSVKADNNRLNQSKAKE